MKLLVIPTLLIAAGLQAQMVPSARPTFPDSFTPSSSSNCLHKIKQSLSSEPTNEECLALLEKAHTYGFTGKPGDHQRQYDTAKKYVELCANVKIRNGYGEQGFMETGSANGYRNRDPNRFVEYREWLKSVLYLNPNTTYYCTDINEIIGTFEYNPPGGYDFKAMEAILRWAHDSSKCTIYYSDIEERLAWIHKWWHQAWVDTTSDTIANPWDTTDFPTIDELNLSILRGQPASADLTATTNARLIDVAVERNPLVNEVILKVQLDGSTLLLLDIFDELGRRIYREGLGYKLPGEFECRLNSQSWAMGTYYARLSTPSGEVKTVKFIKVQ